LVLAIGVPEQIALPAERGGAACFDTFAGTGKPLTFRESWEILRLHQVVELVGFGPIIPFVAIPLIGEVVILQPRCSIF
jgi:hypothetical protein